MKSAQNIISKEAG